MHKKGTQKFKKNVNWLSSTRVHKNDQEGQKTDSNYTIHDKHLIAITIQG